MATFGKNAFEEAINGIAASTPFRGNSNANANTQINTQSDTVKSNYQPQANETKIKGAADTAKRKQHAPNSFTQNIVSETQDLQNVSIPDQVKFRFKQEYSEPYTDSTGFTTYVPTGFWYDNDKKESVSEAEKDIRAQKMENDYADANGLKAANDGEEVAPSVTDGRDFSDEFDTWLANSGLGYSDLADFVFHANMDEWRNYVQDDVMKDWYQGLYNPDGTFNEDYYTDYWNENKGQSYLDRFTIRDDLGTNSTHEWLGSDYDAVMNVLGYLYDKHDMNVGEKMAEKIDLNNRDDVLNALGYEYITNAATDYIGEDVIPGQFAQDFRIDDINRFIGNDDYMITTKFDGNRDFISPEDKGMINANPSIMLEESPYVYSDGRAIPYSGALDNILRALNYDQSQIYGVKRR